MFFLEEKNKQKELFYHRLHECSVYEPRNTPLKLLLALIAVLAPWSVHA
jgi:hypothetical protein